MKLIILTVALLVVGFLAGTMTQKHLGSQECGCTADLSVALEGCEAIASSVNEQLTECRWDQTNCEHEFNEHAKRSKEMLKLFLPNRFEGE